MLCGRNFTESIVSTNFIKVIMMLEGILIAITLILFVIKFYGKIVRPNNFPPGPPILPIVGSLPFLGPSPFQTLLKWRTTFGPVIGLYMGSFRAIILTDYELMKSVFSKEEANGRPEFAQFLKSCGPGRHGITFTEGTTWRDQRDFTFQTLKDLGFGKEKLEAMMIEDVEEFYKYLLAENADTKPISIYFSTRLMVLRSLWKITTGQSYPINDTKLTEISQCLSSGVQKVGFGGAALFFPWLTRLFPKTSNYFNLSKALDTIHDYIYKEFELHKETYSATKPRDWMDLYIGKIIETSNSSSSFYGGNGEKNLIRNCMNIFGAGTEQGASVLNWSILRLGFNDQFQSQIGEEIDKVIGARTPSLNDKKAMEYTRAFITEIFRTVPSYPFILPHRTLRSMNIGGYKIPQNTLILGSSWLVNQHPQQWENSSEFNPNRWIGNKKNENPPIVTFSTGLRTCPGESYARNSLFLFITIILQKFRIELVDDKKHEHIKNATEPFQGVPDFLIRLVPKSTHNNKNPY